MKNKYRILHTINYLLIGILTFMLLGIIGGIDANIQNEYSILGIIICIILLLCLFTLDKLIFSIERQNS